MTTTTISPFIVSDIERVELADEKGGKQVVWRKEILPSGKRNYQGKELDFSKINPACIQAFNDKAVDSVPLVLALSDNKHPETGQELEYLEGDLSKLEMSSEGSLFGYFDLTKKVVDKIEASGKKLGVSARIDVDYEREDVGKKYPYALRHVCATTAAHIKGMQPWEKVELSEEDKDQETLDLSTEVIDEIVETKTETDTEDELVAVEIPKEKLDKLLAFLTDMEKGEEVANKLNDNDEVVTTATLSEVDSKRIELAEKRAEEATKRVELAEAKVALAEWSKREAELAAAGVPPVMLAEAKKVLSLPKATVINLSENESVDVNEVVNAILELTKGFVDLSEELGHGVGEKETDEEAEEFKAFQSDIFSNL